MNALIIGGTRFLGYHLTRKLLNEGVEVTLYNRGLTPDDFGDKVKRVIGDRKNYKKFYESFRRQHFDVVVDMIGYHPEDVEVAEQTFRDHIGQYIFISTGQVYLVTENKRQPAGEEDYYQKLIDCPLGEENEYQYGVKKRQIEDFLEGVFRSRGFPSVRFRCPIIHGPRDHTLRLYSYLLRIADGHPLLIPENGDSIIRHIYVEDVVKAIFSVLQRRETNGMVFNLAQEEVLQLSDFIKQIAMLMNSTADIFHVPESSLSEYSIPPDISPFSGIWVSYMDPSLAKREIGFQSTPLKEWLPAVIQYFMEEYAGNPPDNYQYRQAELKLIKEKFKQDID